MLVSIIDRITAALFCYW